MAEPNVEGKPSKGTYAKILLVALVIAILFTWMFCAALGMPVL